MGMGVGMGTPFFSLTLAFNREATREHNGGREFLFPSPFSGSYHIFGNQMTTWPSSLQHSCDEAFWVGLAAGCSLCISTRNGGHAGVPLHEASAQAYSSWWDHTVCKQKLKKVTTQETQNSVAFVSAWFWSQLCSTAPSSSPRRAGRCSAVDEAFLH